MIHKNPIFTGIKTDIIADNSSQKDYQEKIDDKFLFLLLFGKPVGKRCVTKDE